jgi:pantoate--beta-alanine ligase
MNIISSIEEMRRERDHLSAPVGFVPTMGYLHEGHLSLVRRARAENGNIVVSIFVNPTQFGPGEDLRSYPRDTERDLELLRNEHVDVIFCPLACEMYPAGYSTWVTVEGLTQTLEAKKRPGHFRGVTTVCSKLFNLVRPARAYFGQKDAQQALVIKRMTADLNMGIEIMVLPTIREPDGLAMSSRNVYLNPDERKAATILFRSLQIAENLWRHGERKACAILGGMAALLKTEPLARVDYLSVADPSTLEEMTEISDAALVSLAVNIGRSRLIDNTVLGKHACLS